jgi:[ribosomal protein S18]-alanine N-acetyltransferase
MTFRTVELGLARSREIAALAVMSRDLVETGLRWTYRAPRMQASLRDPDVIALVARDGLRLAGFAIMRLGDERARLVLLAVDPAWQRRGIARRMLRWLSDSAAAAGTASIHVELRAGNAAAQALYESEGFAETFRLPGYYEGRETAVRMIRLLRAPGVVVPEWQPPASR